MDKYDKSNAQMIIDGSGLFGPDGAYSGLSFLRVDDRGVWPDKDGCADVSFWLPEYLWKPYWELVDHPDEPNDPNQEPGLPFPFDEYQLAAWMMGGLGGQIAGHYGDWDAGPDQEMLAHPDARKARRGVTRAFELVRAAMLVVGSPPVEVQSQWHLAEDEYARALGEAKAREGDIDRARALLIGLREQADALKVKSEAAMAFWRRAMVRQLHDARRATCARQAQINTILSAQATPEYQRDAAHAETVLKRLDNANATLAMMTDALGNAPKTGDVGKIREAQAAVDEAQQDVERVQATIERLRGDDPLMGEAAFVDGFDSETLGHELAADHWASLPTIQAKHAAMLMAGINPGHYPNPDQSAPPSADLPRYRSALYTFESYGHDGVKRSLRDWVGLAQSHGLQTDVRVLAAVASAPAPTEPRKVELATASNDEASNAVTESAERDAQTIQQAESSEKLKKRILSAYRGGAHNVSALEREHGVPRRTINRLLADAGLKNNKK